MATSRVESEMILIIIYIYIYLFRFGVVQDARVGKSCIQELQERLGCRVDGPVNPLELHLAAQLSRRTTVDWDHRG